MNLYQAFNMNGVNFLDPKGLILHIQNNEDIMSACSILINVLGTSSTIENKIGKLEESDKHYFIEDGSEVLGRNIMGLFKLEKRDVGGRGEKQAVGVLYLNLNLFKDEWRTMVREGKKLPMNTVQLMRI